MSLRPAARAMGIVAVCAGVSACSSAGDIIGLVSGAAAGGATANPAVGYVVGVGVAVGADETLNWITRRRHRAEQDAIADAAGGLTEGQVGVWQVRHDIPIGNAHGAVQVLRAIDTPLATCREISFSVIDDPDDPPEHFVTTICRADGVWKWALAEPAVERWATFQSY